MQNTFFGQIFIETREIKMRKIYRKTKTKFFNCNFINSFIKTVLVLNLY